MKKTYVLVGAGHRARIMFAQPLAQQFTEVADFVGICDPNPVRAEYVSKECGGIPVFADFDLMLRETKPDYVIVTTPDGVHHEYIIRAMEAGCDVISEKPMTIDAEKCKDILETERRTGKRVTVTFNARFIPYMAKVKQLLSEGAVGDILNVNMQWMLDTVHGADYFRRWHSNMANSGGLLVHKSTHHFDLVNWWVGDEPEHVQANGGLYFYGPTRDERGTRCLTCDYKKSCEFYMDITQNTFFSDFYAAGEKNDGYMRDKCVFSEDINIYDTMSLSVKYNRGALLTYSLNAYSPYEGWKVVIGGTKGSLEASLGTMNGESDLRYIHVYNLKREKITHEIKLSKGTHGGGDDRLRAMLFEADIPDPLGQMAGSRAGAMSLLIGASANESIAAGGRKVEVRGLVDKVGAREDLD